MENTVWTALEEYKEVPETVPLNLTEDGVTWFSSKLSGAAGTLGAEATEPRNWLLRFEWVSEELRIVVSRLVDWMPPPPLGRLLHTNDLSPGGT